MGQREVEEQVCRRVDVPQYPRRLSEQIGRRRVMLCGDDIIIDVIIIIVTVTVDVDEVHTGLWDLRDDVHQDDRQQHGRDPVGLPLLLVNLPASSADFRQPPSDAGGPVDHDDDTPGEEYHDEGGQDFVDDVEVDVFEDVVGVVVPGYPRAAVELCVVAPHCRLFSNNTRQTLTKLFFFCILYISIFGTTFVHT